MKGRFKTPIWVIPVLAMVLALGAYAVFAGINQFAASPAEADLQEAGRGLSATVDTEKLTEPLKTPLQEATQVVTASAVQNPDRPGSLATYTFTFVTPNQLDNGIDEVILTFDSEFQVPTQIDRNQVSLRTTAVTGGVGGTAGESVPPESVSTDLVGSGNDQPELRLRVPDMDTSDDTGGQSIADGATVTVVFRQGAGIMNPTEGGTDPISVRVTDGGTDPGPAADAPVNLVTPFIIEMSNDDGSRGDSVTLVGRGFKNATTTTFWLDVNGNGDRDAGERDLCSAVAGGDDIATCTFTVSNPPFQAGSGGDCDFGSLPTLDCNYINAIDGRSNTASQRNQTDINRTNFELEPTLRVSPESVNVGDRVTVSLFDYPEGGTVDHINLAGVAIDGNTSPTLGSLVTGLSSIPASGQETFTFTLPGTVSTIRIPTGVQQIAVFTDFGTVDEADQDVNITIGGANLSLSHETVLANQDLTISGNGFTERGTGGVVCVLEGDITLNNIQLRIDSDSLDAACQSEHNAPGVELSSGGTFTATVQVVDTAGVIDVALLTEGSHELKIIDSSGAEGTLLVDIPERTIEVTPASARPRDVVTIIGTNFPADNPDTGSVAVEVLYDCGGNNTRRATADPDASGNFRETLRIPTNCSIPSTNTITADVGQTGVTETVIHDIPDAFVRIEPVRGQSGTMVTVEGEGFRTFETVQTVEFAGRGTLGGRTANTDERGNFSITDVLVPGLDPGVHAVIVEVGSTANRVTASTSFEVLERGVAGIPTDVIPGLADPLGDNLVRVFFFNNNTKEWTFFDPRPEFEDANTLDEVNEGNPIWVRVNEDQEVDLNNEPRNLTCVNPGTPEEDCWNLIVW